MRRVGLVTDALLFAHRCVPVTNEICAQQKENPDRLAVVSAIIYARFPRDAFTTIPSRSLSDADLSRCHDVPAILAQIRKIASKKGAKYDADVDLYVDPEYTERAARLAAGCSVQLVEAIMSGRVQSGFAAIRPPGHHAHYSRAAGFCIFNNAMLAAAAAARRGKRVLVIDFDVHVGDGTIDVLETIGFDNIAYASIHRHEPDFYPHTAVGAPGLTHGGRVLNVAYSYGPRGDDFYDEKMRNEIVPFGISFRPDIIVVSAGFDAARGDPLGHSDVTPLGYANIMRRVQSINRNIAMVLEGGYDLSALADSVEACLKVLLEETRDYTPTLLLPMQSREVTLMPAFPSSPVRETFAPTIVEQQPALPLSPLPAPASRGKRRRVIPTRFQQE